MDLNWALPMHKHLRQGSELPNQGAKDQMDPVSGCSSDAELVELMCSDFLSQDEPKARKQQEPTSIKVS